MACIWKHVSNYKVKLKYGLCSPCLYLIHAHDKYVAVLKPRMFIQDITQVAKIYATQHEIVGFVFEYFRLMISFPRDLGPSQYKDVI